jgi:hypothetical protein
VCAGTRVLDVIRHRYDDGELTGPATRKTNVRTYTHKGGYYDKTVGGRLLSTGERAHRERRTVTQTRRDGRKGAQRCHDP